ncbi:hypothetical protein ACM9HF_05465 [Colwellia sp. RE-S-Sl-9]
MKTEHLNAENKYQQYRNEALALAKKNLPYDLKDNVIFRDIDKDALLMAQIWESSPYRKNLPWSFSQGYKKWAYRHPDRLDLAVWLNTTLCSLAIGFPTKTGQSMRLDVIEKNPCEQHILDKRIFEINITVFEAYADLIGASQIKIMRPLNDKLIHYYRNHGFIYQKSKGSDPEHLWKML